MQPSPGLIRAREKFAQRFKKAVLVRIARQEEERASRSPEEINRERDQRIVALHQQGASLAEILTATESKAGNVRRLLGMPPPAPQQPRLRVRAAQPAL